MPIPDDIALTVKYSPEGEIIVELIMYSWPRLEESSGTAGGLWIQIWSLLIECRIQRRTMY